MNLMSGWSAGFGVGQVGLIAAALVIADRR